MGSANERQRFIVTLSLNGEAHDPNDPCDSSLLHINNTMSTDDLVTQGTGTSATMVLTKFSWNSSALTLGLSQITFHKPMLLRQWFTQNMTLYKCSTKSLLITASSMILITDNEPVTCYINLYNSCPRGQATSNTLT